MTAAIRLLSTITELSVRWSGRNDVCYEFEIFLAKTEKSLRGVWML